MIPVNEATSIILAQVSPLTCKADRAWVPLEQAAGRILAAPVVGQLDLPHWVNSAMDGYAVRQADVVIATPEQPVELAIAAEIPAGQAPQITLQPGQCARIFTGAMLPAGADTVVMQEHTQREGDRVRILQAPKPHAFVRQQGNYYQAGTPLLPAGVTLGAAAIALLASAQCASVPVVRPLRVAILSTGDELVPVHQPLQPGQIVDANQYALASLVRQCGAEPLPLGIVPDTPEALKTAIAQACATADVVLSSGGVSVGDYDYIDHLLAQLGATLHIRQVAIKPGKPLTFATVPQGDRATLYFGLPGNPVSALVTFWRFVQPALAKAMGQPATTWSPTFVAATTHDELRAQGQRETYLWGRLTLDQGNFGFQLAPGSQSSANLVNLAQANGLAVVPVGITAIAPGATVMVMTTGHPAFH